MKRRDSGILIYFIALAIVVPVAGALMWNVWAECLEDHSFWFCAVALGGR